MIRRSDLGFSLVELAMVLALVAIVAGFSIPQVQGYLANYRLSSSANTVAAELSAGRALAISRSWNYEVSVDTTNHTVQIIDPDDSSNNPRNQTSLETGITISAAPSPQIRFYSRGQARGGTITLRNANGNTISVTVTLSGKVQVGSFS